MYVTPLRNIQAQVMYVRGKDLMYHERASELWSRIELFF